MKIYRKDGTFLELDEYEVFTFKAEDTLNIVNHENGVKMTFDNGREYFIESATVKEFERKRIPYKEVEINL